ncbi:uncharacterized protein [Lepeophtheirus salmonis]|nr:uncharacterized protein LOC121121640 [Lepeophtheirus salmonis]
MELFFREKWTVLGALLLMVSTSFSKELAEDGDDAMMKDKKVLNVFSVVRFRNDPCSTGDNTNGTCYTTDECTARGGTPSGDCASGYGVCCVFTFSCGQTSAENCTYFIGQNVPDGQCRLEICPCSDNICQLRLDFTTFDITGPSTNTISVGKNAALKEVTNEQRCLTDTFAVTNPGGASPPVICGMNSGEHMYVDSSEQCNELAFNLQGANARQMWNIKITQFSCDFDNLAPEGCTQYFFGSNTGIVKTYNFDGGQHLDNQNQRICVRRERGNCRICWTATADTDFELTGDLTKSIADGKCCGDGPANGGVSGTDCVIIPGASKEVDMKDLVKVAALGLCGGKFGSKDNQNAHKTICSMILPFNIRFLSDTFETSGVEKGKQPNGFKLSYKMRACT